MRVERDLMRGAGPVAVLKLLEAGPKYGYELIEALMNQTDGIFEIGQSTLYPLLYNLEAQGLIKPKWELADTGRKRKYYSLTAKGKKRLARDVAQWRAIAKAMLHLGVLDEQPTSIGFEGGEA